LLPGLDGTGDLFAPLIPHLEPEFELSVVEYSTQDSLADLVETALAQLPNKRNISLIAESFSGPVAISILAQGGALFGPSVLCATFTKSPYRYLAKLAKRLPVSMWDLDSIKEALNNSSLNYQSTGNIKCDFMFSSIFNRLRRSKMAAHPCAADVEVSPAAHDRYAQEDSGCDSIPSPPICGPGTGLFYCN